MEENLKMREIYEPFDNAEEVWFWFCRSLEARGDGLRSQSDYPGKRRFIEIGDIARMLKQMRTRGEITNRCLRTMSKWGRLGTPPYYDSRAKRSEIRLWEYGIYVLNLYLKAKGIL